MKQHRPAAPHHSREGGQTKSLIPAGGIATLHYLASERRAQAAPGNAKSGGRIGGRTGFAAHRKAKTMTTTTITRERSQPPLSAAAPQQFQMHTYVAPFAPPPYPYPVGGAAIGLNGFSLLGCILTIYVVLLALWCWITPNK